MLISIALNQITQIWPCLTKSQITKSNLHNLNITQEIHDHNTCNNRKIAVPRHRRSITATLQINMITLYNKLRPSAKTVSFNPFEKSIV